MFILKRALYTFILIAPIIFTSCSESTSPYSNNDGLIPLSVGNSWSYQFTDYDSSGAVIYTEIQTNKIDKDTIISNNIWYGYNYIPVSVWFINKADGYWSFAKRNGNTLMNDTSIIVYKYPTKAGDVYGNPYTPSEVISTEEEITVPAGTFNAIHITTNYSSLNNNFLYSFETYIVPHIGVIKLEQIGKKSNGDTYIVYKSELESYSLKN